MECLLNYTVTHDAFNFLNIFIVGYTSNDVIYKWNGARQAVAIAEDMKLSQFDLVDCPAANITDTIAHSNDDVLPIDGENTGSKRRKKSKTIYSCKYHLIIHGRVTRETERVCVCIDLRVLILSGANVKC